MELPLEKIEYVSFPFDFYFQPIKNSRKVFNGIYQDIPYSIESDGNFPIAFIHKNAKTYKNRYKLCFVLFNDQIIHDGILKYESPDKIGWSYDLADDFNPLEYRTSTIHKKWIFEEVENEIKKAIDKIKKFL